MQTPTTDSSMQAQGETHPSLHCHYLYHNRFEAGPDYVITAHNHLFWHTEFVRSGMLEVTVAGKPFTVTEGEAILLPPEQDHAFVYRNEKTNVFSIKYEAHNPGIDIRPYVMPAADTTRQLLAALDGLLVHQAWPSPDKMAAIEHLLAAHIHLAAHRAAAADAPEARTLPELIKERIEASEGKALTVGAIARELGYSETHIRSQFKRAEGSSLKEYIDRHRSNVAVQYLSYSDMPIKEIVALMEFPDPQCFSRFCKRMTGRSPKTIRRWLKQGTNLKE